MNSQLLYSTENVVLNHCVDKEAGLLLSIRLSFKGEADVLDDIDTSYFSISGDVWVKKKRIRF